MTDEAAGASPHDRGVGRLEPARASIGDTVECDIRQPFARTERLTLTTQKAADYATELLRNPASGWRKSRGCPECAWGKVLGCWCKPKQCHADVLAELADSGLFDGSLSGRTRDNSTLLDAVASLEAHRPGRVGQNSTSTSTTSLNPL